MAACGKETAGDLSGTGQESEKKSATSCYPTGIYWAEDYKGPLGLQYMVSEEGEPLMMLAGKPLYLFGTNNYNLLMQALGNKGNHNRELIRQTVEVLRQERVPYIRFMTMPYYHYEMNRYTDDKEAYYVCLDYLATLCDEAHILIMPCLITTTECLPTYFGETKQEAWGNTSSKSYNFMIEYTREVIDCLKSHKCLAAWEFGSEFNLAADIGIVEGHEQMSADCVGTSLKGFAETCMECDPEKRLVLSGHAFMRNAQYHLYTEKNWTVDTYDQYKFMTGLMTPDPMMGMTEHIYDTRRVFRDLGTLSLEEQLAEAKRCARELGKVYAVDEFTGPHFGYKDWEGPMERSFEALYNQKVQLCLVWNYALKGDVAQSFKADTEWGDATFRLVRKYNKKCELDYRNQL